MRKLFLSYIFIVISFCLQAQIITESVNFDNYISLTNNDLTNSFKFGTFATNGFIRQITTNGITGGALEPPSNVNGGNDVLRYCSKYKNSKDSLMETSLAFFYNSSLINPNANADCIFIWLKGNTNNHNVAFYLTEDQELGIDANNYNQRIQINLTSGHWYNFVGQYKTIGGTFNDQVFTKVEIFDLGITGNSLPTSVGSHTATLYDSYLVSSNDFIVELSAAKWGGSEYLDNFVFKGENGGTICNSTNIANFNNVSTDLIVFPNPAKDQLNVRAQNTSIETINIYNVNGQLVKSLENVNNNNCLIFVNELPNAVYMIKIKTDKGVESFKFMID